MDSEGNPIGELQTLSYYGSGDAYTVTPPVIKGYRLLNVNPQSLIDKLGITNVVDQQGKIDSSNIGNIYNVVYEYVKEVPLTYSVIDDTTGETLEEHQDLATGALNQEANIKENQDKLKALQESYKSKGYLLGNIENGNLPVPTDEKGYNVTLHLSHDSHKAVIDGKSKMIIQTVHYQGAGNETPEDNVQTLTFTSKITQTIDNVTDCVLAEAKPVWPEQQSTYAVDSPTLKDYAADKESVPSMNYNYDSEDVVLEVNYSSTIAPITYSVIDDTAGKTLEDKKDLILSHVLEPINTSDNQDKLKSIVKSYTDKGYVLGNIENEELPTPEDTKGYDVTLLLTHGTCEKVIDGESKTVTQKIQYKGAGTKTPEEDIQKFVFTSTLTQTIDNVTGDVISTSGTTWSDNQHSKAVKTPEIDGYSSDIATVKSYNYDHEAKDKTITVSYKEVPPVVKEIKKVVKNILPQTGTEAEMGLVLTGAIHCRL